MQKTLYPQRKKIQNFGVPKTPIIKLDCKPNASGLPEKDSMRFMIIQETIEIEPDNWHVPFYTNSKYLSR